MIPEWLEPVRAGAADIAGEQLSRFLPPTDRESRQGAVLMLFGEGPAGPDLLLTERAHDLRSHPGQIAFPGGSIDPGDASPIEAALREAEEETGLDPAGVEVFGTLPQLWLPPSNFAVTTVLGWWATPTPVAVVDPVEVNAVLRVPVAHLLDPANRFTTVHPMGRFGPGFALEGGLVLWGFTAGIVSRLFDHVGWTRPWDESVERPVEDWMIHGRRVGDQPADEGSGR